MATRKEQLEIGIVATDKASKVLGDVAGQVGKLDGETAEVGITAQDQASDEIALLLDAISRLDAADAEVVLKARADDFKKEMDNALKQIGRVKEQDHLDILIDAKNSAKDKFDAVNKAIEGLDTGATVTIDATDNATPALETLDGSLGTGGDYSDMKADVVIGYTDDATQAMEEVDAKRMALDAMGADVLLGYTDTATKAMEKVDQERMTLDALAADVAVTVDPTSATSGIDTIHRSVDDLDTKMNGHDQSSSVFANFAGNAAQTLPGVASSFGPLNMAISQFVEYGSEGNVQFGGLLKSGLAMAAVGATFAAIGSGVKLLGEESKKSAKNVENIKENMGDLNVSASEFLKTIESNQDMLLIREDITVGWDDYVNTLQEIVHIGDGFGDIDVAQVFDKADISLSRFSRSITGTMDDVGQMEADLLLAREQGKISEDEYNAALQLTDESVRNVADAEKEAADEAKAFAVDTDTASVALQGIVDKAAGMEQFGTAWSGLVADVADGKVDFDASADAINAIAEATGKTSDEIEQMAWDEATQAADDNAQASLDAAAALRDEYIAALEETNEVLDESIDKLNEMADAQQSTGDAALDVRDAQRDAAEAVDTYNEAADEYNKKSHHSTQETNDLAEALDGVVTAARERAKAETEAARVTAAANGVTMRQSQLLDQNNISLLNQANTLGPGGEASNAILNYIEDVNGIPSSVTSDIRAALEAGDIEEANRLLQEASKTRTSYINAEADQAAIDETNRQLNLLTKDRIARIITVQSSVGSALATNKRAIGDANTRPGMYLVGEQGPELVEMAAGQRIHTANETHQLVAAAPSAGVVNNYYYAPAGYSSRGVTNATRRYERIQGPS